MIMQNIDIPDVIVATIIGSFITFIGVTLSNRNNRKIQEKKLDHDNKQQKVEREMTLKKEVFLPFADNLYSMNQMLYKIVDANIEDSQLTMLLSKQNTSLGKIILIGNNETVKNLQKLSTSYESSIFLLFSKRLDLMDIKYKVKYSSLSIDHLSKKMYEVLDKMKNTDNQEYDKLSFYLNSIKSDLKGFEDENSQNSKQLLQKSLELSKLAFEESSRLSDLILPVIVSLRKELNLPFDQDEFKKVLEENLKIAKRNLDNLIADITLRIENEV